MSFIVIDGHNLNRLVHGETVEYIGGISIRLADIGFGIMRSYIDEAERDENAQKDASCNSPEGQGHTSG